MLYIDYVGTYLCNKCHATIEGTLIYSYCMLQIRNA